MLLQEIREDQVNNPQIYDVLYLINTSIYWKDLNGKYLGGNKYFLETFGLENQSQLIGKTDYDLFTAEDAGRLKESDLIAINNGKFAGEESFRINSRTEYFYTTKNKLINKKGNIVGIFGVSTCITDTKNKMTLEKNQAVLEEEIKTAQIVDLVPAYIYWKHKNERYIACNKYQRDKWKFDIAGKTEYDIWSKDEADRIHAIDQYVFENGSYSGEEIGKDPADGTIKYFLSSKQQLLDSKGNVAGIVGISIDISAQKELEKLKETLYQAKIEQQEQFRKIAAQVAHDIGSPLAALKIVLPYCTDLPEKIRDVLNKSATRISDIADNFLSQFKPQDNATQNEVTRMPALIIAEISEILTEKKYQYSKLPIDFISNISQDSAFAFINVDTTSFKRMLSNIINNAVDALEGKIGEITIGLDVNDNQVLITIKDNGKGMPDEIKNKILSNIEVTAGKIGGHGIGFTQIRDALLNNEGTFDIESQLGIGTTIKLSFPKIETPNWIAENIVLNLNDIVIILDDDDSIHSAWELRFENSAPDIQRYHFKQGYEAIDFINGISSENKNKIFLLTDYELLKQGLHGLDVIEKTGVSKSVLVTSHHNNQLVRDKALLTKTKILPKLLASNVAINCI